MFEMINELSLAEVLVYRVCFTVGKEQKPSELAIIEESRKELE